MRPDTIQEELFKLFANLGGNVTALNSNSYTSQAWLHQINELVASSGVGAIKVSPTAPVNPAAGDLWYNSSTGILGFYNGTYWLTVQTFGPRGSFTFVNSPESFVTVNNGIGLAYGAFVEKLVIRYKTRTTAHDVSNYRNLNLTFRGARNQVDELNITRVIPLNNTITNGVLYPYPTTTYVTVEEVINTYAGARGDVNIHTANSVIVAGSPDWLDCSFWLVMRGVLA